MSDKTFQRTTTTDMVRTDLMFRLITYANSMQLRISHGTPEQLDQHVYLYEDDLRELYRLLRPHFEYEMARDNRFHF
jgi:hypothetical protein